jgi:flagellar protein FlbD
MERGYSHTVITLTHLKGEKIVLNADLIESLEATPDTVITLTTGKRIVVRESVEEVAGRVEAYAQRRQVHAENI